MNVLGVDLVGVDYLTVASYESLAHTHRILLDKVSH